MHLLPWMRVPGVSVYGLYVFVSVCGGGPDLWLLPRSCKLGWGPRDRALRVGWESGRSDLDLRSPPFSTLIRVCRGQAWMILVPGWERRRGSKYGVCGGKVLALETPGQLPPSPSSSRPASPPSSKGLRSSLDRLRERLWPGARCPDPTWASVSPSTGPGSCLACAEGADCLPREPGGLFGHQPLFPLL